MPAFLGPERPDGEAPPRRSLTPRAELLASQPTPGPQKQPPLEPEVVAERPARRRSSQVEARERLAEVQLPALNARIDLAGLGDVGRAAKDESVRARLLTDLNVHGGLVVPQVSAQLVIHSDLESALVDLERILGVSGE